jgi:hypothetical protein
MSSEAADFVAALSVLESAEESTRPDTLGFRAVTVAG